MEQEQQFVEYIVKAIVDHPDDVSTEQITDEMGILISLHVNAEDMGTIIGKEGRTAKALRTLLRVMGANHNARVNLKIIEPEGGRGHAEHSHYSEGGEAQHALEEQPLEVPMEEKPSGMHEALSDLPQDELA